MKSTALAILQARTDSTRLPAKALQEINHQPMIIRQIARIRNSKKVEQIVLATTSNESDDKLANIVEGVGIKTFRGSVNDVLSRFIAILGSHDNQIVVRLTADCPLVMPAIIDEMIEEFERRDVDYISNTVNPTFPDGLDVEVFSSDALRKLSLMNLTEQEKEHVTLGFHRRQDIFRVANYEYSEDLSSLRWTVDYIEDLDFVREVYSQFTGREAVFEMKEILDVLKLRPELKSSISSSRRNEALK